MIRIIILALVVLIVPILAIAEEVTEATEFKVLGSCGMCKSRIEKAALIEGVKSAEWELKTQMLKVEFTPTLVSLDDIHKSIAAVGHDTELYQADDEVYSKLPACCLYERYQKPEDKNSPGCH